VVETACWLVEDGIVTENSLVGPDMGRMAIEAPKITAAARPGHFMMVRCWEGEPLLPRAMAPLNYDTATGRMEIYYRIKGPGTEAMAGAPVGAAAHVTGPLGRAITEEFGGKSVVLVGRGVGITPLLPLARHVIEMGGTVRSYLSARTRAYLFGSESFRSLGTVREMVDDEGDAGRRVTDLLAKDCEVERPDVIYVCGSRRLVRHAHEIGERWGAPAYVFLEEKMGCGTGFCKGCPIELREGRGYRLVCTDGPLFPTREIVLA
jgi:dihydroorotate dehydrogenase electron transfer subunit